MNTDQRCPRSPLRFDRMENLWGEVSRDLTGWTLTREHLPEGTWGLTRFRTREIVISPDLLEVEARCTLAHEIEHALHGPVPLWAAEREEQRASEAAARRLLPEIRSIADALDVTGWDYAQAADELHVDEDTLMWRLRTLDLRREAVFMHLRFAQESS